jgi:TIR domain-containing protein
MNAETFTYDVFLSHSAKDKAVVRPLAERLRKDRLKVWFDEWVLPSPAGAGEGGRRSGEGRGAEGAKRKCASELQLSAFSLQPFLGAPLNKERPLRLDDAPIKGSLAQFLYINWLRHKQEYVKLLEVCRTQAQTEATLAVASTGPVEEPKQPPLRRRRPSEPGSGFVGRWKQW